MISNLICKRWRCGTVLFFLRRKLPERYRNPARGGALRVESLEWGFLFCLLFPCLTGRIDESSRLSFSFLWREEVRF